MSVSEKKEDKVVSAAKVSEEPKKQLAKFIRDNLPQFVIGAFLILLFVLANAYDLDSKSLFSDLIKRAGFNSILVLAMVPALKAGIGLNFGVSIGIEGGLLAGLLALEFGMRGIPAFVFAMILGFIISGIYGLIYGILLNGVKGSEMTISTYAGFSFVALMSIVWSLIPLKSEVLGWSIGDGLKNTISLDGTFGGILNNNFVLNITNGTFKMVDKVVLLKEGMKVIPLEEHVLSYTGISLPLALFAFVAVACFIVWAFTKSKLGISMEAVGKNPSFAKVNGISVNKMRIIGTVFSTGLGAIGILVFAQGLGFLQLYNAPLMMPFAAVAAILIGGATVKDANIFNVLLGVFLFQGTLVLGVPVTNAIIPSGGLSEIMRMVISNGIILFALTQAKGSDSNV